MFENHIAEVQEFETGFDFEDFSDDDSANESDHIDDMEDLCARSDTSTRLLEDQRSSVSAAEGLRIGGHKNARKTNDLTTPLFDFEENGF